ncbi:MAG: hypothetical protein K2N74_01900, partial [Clostridiales bacterium]|nr:hypothetical protein [Clostridiales bacterium]
LIIVAACFFCTVSFSYDNGLHGWHSIVELTDKDATLGGTVASDYKGGSYVAAYYPEGVITAKEYENNIAGYKADIKEYEGQADKQKELEDTKQKLEEYEGKYTAYGSLYLETEKVMDGDKVSEEFKNSFAKNVCALKERFGALNIDGASLSTKDEFTVEAVLPQKMSGQNSVYNWFAYTGEFTVHFGSDEDSATKVLPENKKDAVITDYVKSAGTRRAADGQYYVSVTFTSAGAEAVKSATTEASSSALFFKVGDDSVISLSVDSQLDQKTLYIGGNGVYTQETASATAALINSALKGTQTDLKMTCGDVYQLPASFGNNALMLLYIAFGVCFAAMMVFFFVRYGLLGFVHLYTYLIFLFALLVSIYGISFLYIGTGTALAVLFTSVLLCVSNAVTYEYARKQYATGKTMAVSIKNGYKKCFWHIFDIHIALATFAFILYAIALPSLSAFAFVLGLGTLFSGVCSLLIGRFIWAIMMPFAKNQSKFCRFKKEEVEDDE